MSHPNPRTLGVGWTDLNLTETRSGHTLGLVNELERHGVKRLGIHSYYYGGLSDPTTLLIYYVYQIFVGLCVISEFQTIGFFLFVRVRDT